jgi:hypothetical protein
VAVTWLCILFGFPKYLGFLVNLMLDELRSERYLEGNEPGMMWVWRKLLMNVVKINFSCLKNGTSLTWYEGFRWFLEFVIDKPMMNALNVLMSE